MNLWRWRQGQTGQLDGLQGWRGRGLTLLGWRAAPFLGVAGGPGPGLRAAGAPLAVGWCICGERCRQGVRDPAMLSGFLPSTSTHLSPRAAIFKTQVRPCLATEARILRSQYVIVSNNLVASGSLSGKGSRRPAAESGRANLESRRFRPSDTPPGFSDLFAGSQGERCGARSSRGCLLCGCQSFNLSSGLYQFTPRPPGLPPSPLTWHLIHAHELEHSPHEAVPGFPDPA